MNGVGFRGGDFDSPSFAVYFLSHENCASGVGGATVRGKVGGGVVFHALLGSCAHTEDDNGEEVSGGFYGETGGGGQLHDESLSVIFVPFQKLFVVSDSIVPYWYFSTKRFIPNWYNFYMEDELTMREQEYEALVIRARSTLGNMPNPDLTLDSGAYLLEDNLPKEAALTALTSLFSQAETLENAVWVLATSLHEAGVSLRVIGEAIEVPTMTVKRRIEKVRENRE